MNVCQIGYYVYKGVCSTFICVLFVYIYMYIPIYIFCYLLSILYNLFYKYIANNSTKQYKLINTQEIHT